MQGYKSKRTHTLGTASKCASFTIARYVEYAILLWLLGLQKKEKWDRTITFCLCKHEVVCKALFSF